MTITEKQKQHLVDSLISEWESMKSSFTRDELVQEDNRDLSGIDVRLQFRVYEDGSLNLFTGSSQYDPNHFGCWGYGFLDYDWDEEILETLVTELVDDLVEQVEIEIQLENSER